MGIMQWEGVVGEEGLVHMEEPAVGGRECPRVPTSPVTSLFSTEETSVGVVT